jgi:DNA-binding NtrC family response regulator
VLPVTSAELDRPTLLVIDAEPEARRDVEHLLEPTCQVLSFQFAAAGIDALDEETAAVILDVGSSGRDSLRVFDELLAKRQHLPVIFMSTYQDVREVPNLVSRQRPFAHFVRGGDPRLLLDIVDRAVRYSRAIAEIKRLVVKVQAVQESRQKAKIREA